METITITVKSKTPELREINYFGAKGWRLEQIRDIHHEGIYSYTEYYYIKIPLITRILSFIFNCG